MTGEAGMSSRMWDMIPSPIDLVVTHEDKASACDLIGTDTYGKPVWTPDTISECNRVVQAFARHRVDSLMCAALERMKGPTEHD